MLSQSVSLSLKSGVASSQSRGINSLFYNNEPGAWYDPSDFTTLFQDAAGTTPVTAVEQPVGRILDKSGRGNHATQTTAASRPVLSARVNLLTKSEQFDDVYWSKTNITITPNDAIAPNGTMTAEKIVSVNYPSTSLTRRMVLTGVAHSFSCYAKPDSALGLRLDVVTSGFSSGASCIFNLLAGTSGAVTQFGPTTGSTASIENVGDGWFRCSITLATSSENQFMQILPASNGSIFIWGADLRVTNTGVNLPPYQRVNTATDYDTAGFPHYLRFDGVDDFLQTNAINFTSTNKMTVFAGVRKLSDAARAIVAELGNNQLQSFKIEGPNTAGASQWLLTSGGSSVATAVYTNAAVASPVTNVLTGVGDISNDQAILRINGTQAASNTANQGTGTYGNLPLYIGRRAGTSLPFNGHLYQLIVRGAQSTPSQIQSGEAYTNSKTKAYA